MKNFKLPTIIDEKPETRLGEIIEPIRLSNISGRRVYSHTPFFDLEKLIKLASKQYGWELNTAIGRICANRHVINSAINN